MRQQRGTTLIELMVALVVGMLVAIAVFSILALAEGRRRATTTVNALNADGQIALGQIERWLRSVGSGLSNSGNFAYGCTLNASKGSAAILPLPAALAAPFSAFKTSTPIRLAPVIIWPGANTPPDSGNPSDVLMLMASGTGGGGLPVALDVAPDGASIALKNHSLDFMGGDLVLVADGQSANGKVKDCTVTQVQTKFVGGGTKTLPLDGPYNSALTGFTGDAAAINLGNPTGEAGAQGAMPRFMLVGVGESSTLFTFDLLRLRSSTAADEAPSPVAGGVLEMRALYGIGTKGDGKVDSWVRPVNDYAPASLLDGSAQATARIKSIKAIRVGLILRTTLSDRPENQPGAKPNANAIITDAAPALFTDPALAALTYTRPWGSSGLSAQEEQRFRYRTMEVVLPIRSAVIAEVP